MPDKMVKMLIGNSAIIIIMKNLTSDLLTMPHSHTASLMMINSHKEIDLPNKMLLTDKIPRDQTKVPKVGRVRTKEESGCIAGSLVLL